MPQSEESDSFSDNDHRYGSDAITGAADRIMEKTAQKKKSRGRSCPVCLKGFQMRRQPPLHVVCSGCRIPVHKRCLSKKALMGNFTCEECASATLKLVPSFNETQSSAVGPNIHAKVCSSGPG